MNNEEKNNLVDLSLKDVKKLYFASIMTKINFYLCLVLAILTVLVPLGWTIFLAIRDDVLSQRLVWRFIGIFMCPFLCTSGFIFLVGYIPLRYRSLTTKYYYLIASLISSFVSVLIVIFGVIGMALEANEHVPVIIFFIILFLYGIFNLLLFLPTNSKYFWGKEVLAHSSIKKLYNDKLKEENSLTDNFQYVKTSHIKSIICIIFSWLLLLATLVIFKMMFLL